MPPQLLTELSGAVMRHSNTGANRRNLAENRERDNSEFHLPRHFWMPTWTIC